MQTRETQASEAPSVLSETTGAAQTDGPTPGASPNSESDGELTEPNDESETGPNTSISSSGDVLEASGTAGTDASDQTRVDSHDDITDGGTNPPVQLDYDRYVVSGFSDLRVVNVAPGDVVRVQGSRDLPPRDAAEGIWNFSTELLDIAPLPGNHFDRDSTAYGEGGRFYDTATPWTGAHWLQPVVSAFDGTGLIWERKYELPTLPQGAQTAAAGEYVVSAALLMRLPPYTVENEGHNDLPVYLFKDNGDLVWRKRIWSDIHWEMLTDRPDVFDVDVNSQGEVLVSGIYDGLAFVQSRDVDGNVNWHRSFPSPATWSEVRWTSDDEIVVAGSAWPHRTAIEVRQLTKDGADLWSREIQLSSPVLQDIDLDSHGNIYLAVTETPPAGVLVRVNAENIADVLEVPDAGIPGWQSNDPDEGRIEEPRKCARIARVEGRYDTAAHVGPVPLHLVEVFEICPNEAYLGCELLEDGQLAGPASQPFWPPIPMSSGCWTQVSAPGSTTNGEVVGCCYVEALTDFATDSCEDEVREGMHCAPDDQCMQGRCSGGVCVPEVRIDCDDGNFCSGQEWCDPAVGCRVAFPAAFDDNPCTIDSCDEATATVSHMEGVEPSAPDAGELPEVGASHGDAGADGAAVSDGPDYRCTELCSTPVQVYVATAAEREQSWYDAYVHVTLEEIDCDAGFEHCRRTPNGEVYVSDERGDPLTLPVNDGCAVYRWAYEEPGGTFPVFTHHVQKCCIGQFPFVDGEQVGSSVIEL